MITRILLRRDLGCFGAMERCVQTDRSRIWAKPPTRLVALGNAPARAFFGSTLAGSNIERVAEMPVAVISSHAVLKTSGSLPRGERHFFNDT
jgi:hypothetical protein